MLHQKKLWTSASSKYFVKVSGPTVRSFDSTANSFQQLGPTTAKALKPQSVLWLGTTRSPRTADLKADRPETAEPLVQQSSRSETFKTLEHYHADFIFDMLWVWKPMQINQSNLKSDGLHSSTETAITANATKVSNTGHYYSSPIGYAQKQEPKELWNWPQWPLDPTNLDKVDNSSFDTLVLCAQTLSCFHPVSPPSYEQHSQAW